LSVAWRKSTLFQMGTLTLTTTSRPIAANEKRTGLARREGGDEGVSWERARERESGLAGGCRERPAALLLLLQAACCSPARL